MKEPLMPERKMLYNTSVTVTGGRDPGHAVSDDGILDIALRMPRELGGEGGETNPEQLFAAGYGACFENSVRSAARRQRLEAENVEVLATVNLLSAVEGRYSLGVKLSVSLPDVSDPQQAADLIRAADQACPYSNALRGNVDVGLEVNGEVVSEGRPREKGTYDDIER
jgi:osmotically inducible protein OsmC